MEVLVSVLMGCNMRHLQRKRQIGTMNKYVLENVQVFTICQEPKRGLVRYLSEGPVAVRINDLLAGQARVKSCDASQNQVYCH